MERGVVVVVDVDVVGLSLSQASAEVSSGRVV